MTILSDTDALTLTNALPTLDKPEQDQAKPLLQAYVAAKREQGLAPFEPSAEEKRVTRDRQRANFAGLDKLDMALGADKAKALDAATAGAENPRGVKARAIVEQHIAETIGNLPAGWNEQGWDATKSVYADHVLGIKRDNIQDEELYQLIGQRFQKEDDEQAMWGERAVSLADSAIKGESYADAWKNMTIGIGTDQRWDEKTHDLRRNQFRDFYGKLQAKTTELTPLAEHAVEVLKTYGGTTNLRRAVWNTDSLKNLTSEIANLPREDWPVLASLIQAKNKPAQEMAGEAGVIEKGLAKLGVRTARDFLDLAKDAIDVDQTQVENNARIAKLPYEEAKKAYQAQAIRTRRQQATEFTLADYEAFKAKSDADTKRIDAADFVNGLANGVINPQKFDNYIVDALASAPGMFAYTAMSAVPYVGIPLVLNTTFNKEMRDARSRGVAWGDTSTFSMGSAAVQTALEHFIGQKLLFGTLPVLQRIAAKPLTAATAKAFAGRAAFQFATTYVPEFATEASQDIMGMVFQTIASRLDPSIPAATMEDLKSYGATLPATAIALLPMTLIGTANATFADKAFGRQYLSSERSLMAVGFTKEAAAEILAAPTQEAAYEMVHGFWDNEEKRQMDTEEQRQAMAALESEMAGYSASQSQGASIAQTDAGTYAVYNSVGQYVDEAATVEDALALKEDVDKAEMATNEERVRDLIDFFEARLGGATIYDPNTIQRLSDRIGKPEEQGGMTEQQANALVDLYVKLGTVKPTSTPKTIMIPGESIRVYDAKTKIYNYAERLWAGANPLTLVEEKTETHIKEQIDMGGVTVTDIEGWQDQVEGKQDRAGMNEETRYRSAVEFFSKSAKAYILGRGEQEKALPLTMRAVMEQLREFFANLMELTARLIQMEQDGNLPNGFRAELRRALKLDDAYINRIQAEQEIQANMEADFGKYGDLMSVLRSRKLPAPSTVTEDPLHAEWKQLYDNIKPKDRLRLFVTFKRDAAGQKQKVAGQLDRVRESLTEQGFDFPLVTDMITAIEDAYRKEAAGKKVWPTMTGVGRVASGEQYGATFSLAELRLPATKIAKPNPEFDASRVGTAKLGTAAVLKDTPQDSNVSGDNVPADLLAKQMAKIDYAHLPESIRSEKDPNKKRRKLVNWFKKNLLALHDAFPAELRARATHWYDGANRIAREMGGQFNATVEQASGIIAVFSPQKDWFMNVAQAEQFIELWTNSQDVVLEESLVRAEIEGIIEAAVVPDRQKRKKVAGETKKQTAGRRAYNQALDEQAKAERRQIVEQVIGKSIRQLDATPKLQGWAIRVLAQVQFGRNYRTLSPEGDRLGLATNVDGALSKNGWGSISEIEKAVRIMKDGSLKNISDNLGNEHKVRNFYNNIVAPNSPYGDATMDTHAVAAAHLMPYGAKAVEVGHNFGTGMNGSEVFGISGVYHLYLDAYREAAAERGIQPRQMQSITWEAIRLVYPAEGKNENALASAQNTWKTMSDAKARTTLIPRAIASPVWAGANDGGKSQGLSRGLQEYGLGNVSGKGVLPGVRQGRSGRAKASVSSTFSLTEEELAPRPKRPFSPVVRDLLQRRAAGEPISREAIDTAIRETFPSRRVPVPQPGTLPTREQIDAAIDSGQRTARVDVSTIEPGTPVMLRQDVPAWERKGVGVVTVQWKKNRGYEASAAITNPEFVIKEKLTLDIGLGGNKGPHIRIHGNWDADQSMPTDLENWTQVGFNPDRHSFYYERGTERQVIGGDKAFQIGNTVFVKNAVFGTGNVSNITYSLADDDYTNKLEETIKQRRVAMRVEQDPQYADEVKKAAAAMTYTVRSRSVGDEEAQVIIAKHGGDVAKLREVIMDRTNKVHMDTKTAIAQILMQAANRRGDYAAVSDILSIWAPVATEAGQFIEGLKRFVVLDTEEGAQAYFRREIDRNNRNAPELSEKEKAAIPQIAAELFQVFQDMQERMGEGQLAWLKMDGPLPVSRADALRKFVEAAKQTLWERYQASVANAIEAKVTPKEGGAGKALLQIFSSDIQAEILAALPQAERGAAGQPTAQELANRASDILSQPERYKGIIAEARKRIEASTALTEEQKDAALAALKTKELGGSPVTVILNKLIKQAFDEANTTPRKVAAEGTVKAMEVEGLITSKIAGLFSQDFAKSIAQEVSGIVQNMLADARAEVATVITRKEIQRQFLAEEELQKAKQLLESGTDEEIVAYLDSRRLPDENARLKALREETAKIREELRAKTITAEQLEIALIGRMKAKDIATTRDLRQTIGRALRMFNAGKLSVKGLEQIFRNKYKLPTPSPQQNAELAKLARNIASTPIGSNERVYQTLQLFDYMHEQIRPYDWVDVGVGLWYSGVLSSIITNARNVLGNAAFMAFDVGEMAATKLLTEPGKALDYYAKISNGAVEGLKIGLGLAGTQIAEGRRSPIQQQDAAVERGGGAMESKSKIAGPRAIAKPMEESRAISKYIGRIMSATDATFQASTYELAARHLAIKMVQDRVDAGEITQDMAPYEVERMLNLTAEQKTNHAAQAKTEWEALTENIQRQTDEETWIKNRANELRQMDRNGELVELATRMARRATFQYQPEGVIGVVALSVDAAFGRAMRFAESLPASGAKAKALKAATAWLRVNSVPFIRTPANVFNRGLDYGPVGLVRAMFDAADVPVMVPGGEDYKRSDEEKQRVLMRGIYGTVAMGALLLACVPPAPEDDEKNVPFLQIHGRGSGNRDKDLTQNGRKWKPYSLEVKLPGGGKVFIDYRLMPVAPYLAAIGFVHDRRRYGKDRNQEAVYEAYVFGQGMFTAALGQSPMTSLQELVLSTDENRPTSERAISNVVARATAGQAANLVPMAGFFRSLETLAGGEKKSRADIKSAMLAQLPFGSQFNDPTVDALGEPIKGRFGIGWLADWEKDDSPSARIYKTWADRDVMPSDLNGYRKELGGQFYEFSVERGQLLKGILLANGEERLKTLASLSDQLDDEDRSQARAYMSSLSRAATAQALYKFRQQQPKQAE